MIWANGDKYFGGFRDDKFDGVGTFIYHKNGDIYTGEWVDGKAHGYGGYFYSNGPLKS